MSVPVRTRAAFQALSRTPCRGRSGPIWVAHVPAPHSDDRADDRADDDGSGDERIGVAYAVGRSVGSAVVRNRVRRRLRAVIRELDRGGQLRPGSYLVGARPPAVGLAFDDLRLHVQRAASRAMGS